MDHIAAEVGISRPILYRHFGDRDGLARAVADDFATALEADLRAVLNLPAPPREVLVAAIDAYLAFVERDPNVYRFLLRGNHARRSIDVNSFLQRVSQDVAVVVGEQLRAAGLDSGAAEPWAYGIVGMVQSAGLWWIERRPMPRERLVEYVTALLWEGMSSLDTAGVGAEPRLTLLPLPDAKTKALARTNRRSVK